MKRRPLTKQDMMNTLHRFKACRESERNQLMQTIHPETNKRGIYTSQSQAMLPSSDLLTENQYATQTFGSVLATTRQQRNLLKYERSQKIWDTKASVLSKMCKRDAKTASLMERSDQYAIKIQELDQISKNSKPYENTDAHYQWICSLRASKQHDQNRYFANLIYL